MAPAPPLAMELPIRAPPTPPMAVPVSLRSAQVALAVEGDSRGMTRAAARAADARNGRMVLSPAAHWLLRERAAPGRDALKLVTPGGASVHLGRFQIGAPV